MHDRGQFFVRQCVWARTSVNFLLFFLPFSVFLHPRIALRAMLVQEVDYV